MDAKTELQKNAIVDARKKELEIFQRALDIKWLNDRMEDGRMGRCLALIQREAEMEKDYQERTDHAAIVNARAEYETKLGIELNKIKRDKDCELLRRYYLRERDPRLRVLVKKLEAGYTCRDLKQQILYNEYKRLQEKAQDRHSNEVLQNSLFNNKQAEVDEAEKKIVRTTTYRRDLQQQLVNRERQRQCAYEDTLVEKKMLEEIMRTIADEDHRELEQKRTLTDRSRREMETFAQARQAWREKQKALLILEERAIAAQQRAAADRSASIVAERQRKMREKEEINEKISAKILSDQAAVQHRQDLIKSLQEQEYLEKNVQDDIKERQKLERIKKETKETLTEQMETKKKIVKDMKVVELEFRKKTEAEVAIGNKKELDKERKKREQGLQYAKDLKAQMESNARRRERNNREEEERAAAVWRWHSDWDKEVDQERKSIMKGHGPQLLGYLQAGVVQARDLPTLREGADASPALKGLKIEAMKPPETLKRLPKCNPQCQILREF